MTYNVSDFGDMLSDPVRMTAYAQALREALAACPDAFVLDIGTGTGVMALLACRLGARRVYAVEPLDTIEVGRRAAADNGLAERIHFIQGLSTAISLPQPVDIVVSDLRGMLPLKAGHLEAITDARRRHLRPGGRLLPERDRLVAAPIRADRRHQALVQPWGASRWHLDLSAGRELATGQVLKHRASAGDLVAPPQTWTQLDYFVIENGPLVGSLNWTVETPATAHGIAMWFETVIASSIGFATGPADPPTVYGQAFFPWPSAVTLEAGDRITADLRADPTGGEWLWRWTTTVTDPRGTPRARFAQSTLAGLPLGLDRLRRSADGYVPPPSMEAAIDHLVLGLLDGHHSLGEIAHRLVDRFPDHFSRWQDALTHVAGVAQRYHEPRSR
jgi:protein arginine N-methyltransferase 1